MHSSRSRSPNASFGSYLRHLRKRMGMTQGDLAAAVGYSIAFISSLESNKRQPTLAVITAQFVPALGLTDEPQLAAQLIELAANARGEQLPTSLTMRRQSHLQIVDATPSTCPLPPTPIIGRDDEIARLCNRMIGHSGRLLTLVGPPGVGKTRLALALAAELQRLYRDGCHLITLATLLHPQRFAAEVAIQLGLETQGKTTPQAVIVKALRRKELLLVLDNFEQLLHDPEDLSAQPSAATQAVTEILANCPGVRIIVTSRERLHLRAEQRHRVQPLDLAAAVALFTARAVAIEGLSNDGLHSDGLHSAGLHSDGLNEVATTAQSLIETICRQLDCLPLALELAATHLDLMSPATLLAHLQSHRLDLLTDGAVDLPPRQRTLRSAIQGSYALLTDTEQRLFRQLGVFAGGFGEAALAACGAHHTATATLLNKNLIYAMIPSMTEAVDDGLSTERRFAMLQTIQEFALDALLAQGEKATARRQHTNYFLALAQDAAAQMHGARKGHWLAQFALEHDNLRAALRWSLTHAPEIALDLAVALEEFWSIRGYDSEAERWLSAALAACQSQTVQRVLGLLALANIQRRLGEYPQAGDALAAALTLLDLLDEQGVVRLKFYRYYGWYQYDLHDYAMTIQTFEAGLALARACNDQPQLIQFLTALAHTQRDRLELRSQVIAYLDEALQLLNEVDEPELLAFVLQQYGALAVAAEAYTAAVQPYTRLLTIYRQLGNKLGLAWGVTLLGEVAWFQGDWARAEGHYREAHRYFLALENPDGLMSVLHHLGQVTRKQGDLTAATGFYQQSRQMAETFNNRYIIARCDAGLAQVALLAGDHARAVVLTAAARLLFDALSPFLAPPDQKEYQALLATVQDTP